MKNLKDITRKNLWNYIWVILIALLLLPTNIFCVLDKTGLDGSWRYMINAASSLDLTFGKEIIYTYGPLGFICYALNIDYNFLVTGMIFTIFFVYLLIYCTKFILCECTGKKQAYLMCLFLYFALYILRDVIQYAQQKENYIMFVILFVFTNIFFDMDRRINIVINTLLIVLCFFVKFTLVLTMIPAELFLILYFWDRKTERKWAIGMFGSVVIGLGLSVIGYLLYNPSVQGLVRYIVGAKEISSGYTAAMQLVENTYMHAIFPFLLLLVIGVGAVCLLLKKKGLGWYFLIMDSMLFLAFKHAFIRGLDYTFYSFFFACCVVVLIHYQNIKKILSEFIDSCHVRWLQIPKVVAGVIVFVIFLNGLTFTQTLEQIYTIVKSNLAEAKEASEIAIPIEFSSQIPDDFVAYIGDDTVSIYPNNIIDGYMDELNVIHYPTYQNYCAYTSYLDNLNAEFFSGEQAPEYLIIKYDAKGIDRRVFYIDAPATYNAILVNYSYASEKDAWILLARDKEKKNRTRTQSEQIALLQDKMKDTLAIPNVEGNEKIYISMDYNLIGKIRNLFFATPTVNVRFCLSDGRIIEGRVIPDNLRNGIDLKAIPSSLEESVGIFKGEYESSVESVEIFGDGVKYYDISAFGSKEKST